MKNRWTHKGDRPEYDEKRAGWNISGERPELTVRNESGVTRKLLSVEDKTIKGKVVPEVVADEQLDVQEVSGQSFSRKPKESTRSGVAASRGEPSGAEAPQVFEEARVRHSRRGHGNSVGQLDRERGTRIRGYKA